MQNSFVKIYARSALALNQQIEHVQTIFCEYINQLFKNQA